MGSRLVERLQQLDACNDAIEWAESLDHDDAELAWRECPRGEWLLWLLRNVNLTSEQTKDVVRAACDCAETALEYAGSARSVCEDTLATTRAWTRDEASIDDVRAAAVRAANPVGAAAALAVDAAAAWAARAAERVVARAVAHQRHAEIVRGYFPELPRELLG